MGPLIERAQQERGRLIKEDENKRRLNEQEQVKKKRESSVAYINESIIPRLLFEYTRDIDVAAEALIESSWHEYSLREWPIDEKVIKNVINGDGHGVDSNVSLKLRWGRNGGTYNFITFIYASNGDIETSYSGSPRLRLPFRKWKDNQKLQNDILEKAYKNPHRSSWSSTDTASA